MRLEVAGYNPAIDLNLTGQGEASRLEGSSVSSNLFKVLGAEVALGRSFQSGDDQPGQDNLVLLSHAGWQNKFRGDPAIISRVIALGGVDRQVVGVMAPAFAFPDNATQFWIPLHLDPRDPAAFWARGFMPVLARVIAGLAVGIVTSLALTRVLVTFLCGTAATDPMTFFAVCGVLIAVALLAGYVPARKAARVDPLTALRVE